MEGSPQTVVANVIESITLPEQPVAGLVTFVPLGGDGFSAPKFAYAVRNFALTGDDQLGFIQHEIKMDERWCSLISYVTFNMSQVASADVDYSLDIISGHSAEMRDQDVQKAISKTVTTVNVGHTWLPPPTVLPGAGDSARIRTHLLNVENDIVRVSALIYCFDVRVRETTPMGPLLWARGST